MKFLENLMSRIISTIDKLFYNFCKLRITCKIFRRFVRMFLFHLDNLVACKTKDESVFFTSFFKDFDVSTVHCSECQSTVKHELHIRSSRSFVTCRRNLFRNICCRENLFSSCYAVVFYKYNTKFSTHTAVIVYTICNCID